MCSQVQFGPKGGEEVGFLSPNKPTASPLTDPSAAEELKVKRSCSGFSRFLTAAQHYSCCRLTFECQVWRLYYRLPDELKTRARGCFHDKHFRGEAATTLTRLSHDYNTQRTQPSR